MPEVIPPIIVQSFSSKYKTTPAFSVTSMKVGTLIHFDLGNISGYRATLVVVYLTSVFLRTIIDVIHKRL